MVKAGGDDHAALGVEVAVTIGLGVTEGEQAIP